MREHPPRTSGAQHITDGVDHLPARVLDGTAAGFRRRQQWFQQLPLPVVQVGGINWSVHAPRLRQPAPSSPSCHYASFTFLDTLYELIISRHRVSSLVITSNRSVEEWLSLFDDPILGNSALDRLANASYQIVIEGNSYREKLSPHRKLLGERKVIDPAKAT